MPDTSIDSILRTRNYVAGTWVRDGDDALPVLDKYTGDLLGRVPLATSEQMEEAIRAAATALVEMRSWSAGRRSAALEKLALLFEARHEAFVQLLVREAGKPVSYARSEVDRALFTVRTAVAEALRFAGEIVPVDFGVGEGRTAFTRRVPVGIVAGITPFNFPLNLVIHKLAPALAVGCPIVFKPAPQAPLSALALAGLVEAMDLPPGAVSVLLCDLPVAERLVTDARVAMLTFTGSARVGWQLKSICGHKKITLELGGNAAVIVDESADLAAAAGLVAKGACIYAGQSCISTQRIYVVGSVFDDFRRQLVDEFGALGVGDPRSENVLVGPVIDAAHARRLSEWVQEAKEGGAQVLAGGSFHDEAHHVFAPTLLGNTRPDMKVSCEEVFGPLAILEKIKDFAEGVGRVNDSRFGLQAGVFTNQLDHVKIAHRDLEVGGVIINNVPGFRVDSMPYGGVKESGLGREGVRYAMEEMTEPRLLIY
jgi:glyceraldehyde-3-phosphate dehydrogenase (NADP+)